MVIALTGWLMLAGVFETAGHLSLLERPDPELTRSADVLLQVHACGICGTDLHILSDPPGIRIAPGSILGHEYTAIVLQVGSAVTAFQPGDQVVVEPTVNCGMCEYCRLGLNNLCLTPRIIGVHRDGGMARYNVAPASALHKIRSDVPSDLAALAEPLACVLSGAEKLRVQPGESALILGGGPIGLLFVELLGAMGAGKIIVSEPLPYRARMASECGADVVIDPKIQDIRSFVLNATKLGADVVVDAVGSLFDVAIQNARRGGRIVLFGLNHHAAPTIPQHLITRHELSVYGAFNARHSFPQAVRLIENGTMPLEKLITHRVPLSDAPDGIELLRRGEALKVLILPGVER